jgi:3-oxoacyl-[acyl-carrier-protein] synthase III
MFQAKMTAIGMAVPSKVVDNHFFESIIETTDEWIQSRTGIQRRYHTEADEFTSDLCVKAAADLVAHHSKDLSDVDMILVATISPDQPMPSVACRLQHKLNLPRAGALDVSAACAGFTYAVIVAKGLIAAGTHKKVLVFGGETLSKITDFTDRTSCMLFGDGAGVVLIEAASEGNIGATLTGASGEGGPDLYLSGFTNEIDGQPVVHSQKIVQNGRKVFKWAVTKVSEQMKVLAEKSQMDLHKDVDWFVPHSANLRIIDAICNESGFPIEKVLESIVNYGNTSSASIPLALCPAVRSGKVKSGDNIMLMGFGGGLAYAGAMVKWA